MESADRETFLRQQAQTSPYPIGLEIERAEGVYLYDTNGKRYLDLVAGIAVSNLGHGNPHVLKAIRRQSESYLHVMVYGEFIQRPQAGLVRKLTELLPDPLDGVYLVNSGAEAIEGALKLAKRVTGRTKFIACKGAYHGSTHGALSVSGNETKKAAFRPLLPDVHFIRFNAPEDLSTIDQDTAAVLIETVQGDAGVRIPDRDWIQAVRKRCTEVGALLILDEIQCGIGRTGSWLACEQFDVVPDVITLGKALGGGMPIGAFAARKEHLDQFTFDPMLGHITTFGGHPVVAAAAQANLEALEKSGVIDTVHAKGDRFKEKLQHADIVEVRGIGLMIAVQLQSAEAVNALFDHCLRNGIIGFWFLSNPDSFRIAPPLIISEAEIDWVCSVIREGLDLQR